MTIRANMVRIVGLIRQKTIMSHARLIRWQMQNFTGHVHPWQAGYASKAPP
jgi:hypothetical protein